MLNSVLFECGRTPWVRACVASASACCICILVLGLLIVPSEVLRRNAPAKRHVVFCSTFGEAPTIVSYVVAHDRENLQANLVREIIWRGSDAERWEGGIDIPDVPHACVTMDQANGRLFFMDVFGRLDAITFRPIPEIRWRVGNVIECRGSRQLACTPNGDTLIVLSGGHLYAWRTNAQSATLDWCRPVPIACFAIHPNGTQLVTSRIEGANSVLETLEIGSGEPGSAHTGTDGHLNQLVFSPDGRYLAGITPTGAMSMFEQSGGSSNWELVSLAGLGTGVGQIATFSPRGNILITTNHGSSRLIARDLAERQVVREFDAQDGHLAGCVFLNDEKFISWDLSDAISVWSLSSSAVQRRINLNRDSP